MSKEEIQGKKHGKYHARRRLAKLAIHSVLFTVTLLLLYLFSGFDWIRIFVIILYGSAFWVVSEKFNDD